MSAKPNLVYIFPDEYRVQSMGFRGEDPVLTPHTDAFAAESLVFRNAYSNSPVCSPYRGILFTGKYPHESGVLCNCNTRDPNNYLREDAQCLSDILAENGYQCGYIGKWHLEVAEEADYPYIDKRRSDGYIWDAYTPQGRRRHGFSFWHSYGCCDQHLEPHYWENEGSVKERIDVSQWSPIHETDVAVDYIRNASTQEPFALFLAHNPPHMPFDEVPGQYLERYAGKTPDDLLVRPNAEKTPAAVDGVKQYFAAISGLDDQLQRVLDALDEKGIRNNTIVIYTSDHGEMMGSHGRMGKNTYYDEAFKVPLLIRYPEKIRPRTTDMLLSTVDIMPTLLTIMGLEDQIPEGIHGQNAGNAILENRDGDIGQALYLQANNHRGLADEHYTFAMCRCKNAGKDSFDFVLFDHQKDPYQLHNIASDFPELVRMYHNRLAALLDRCGDPLADAVRAAL